MDTATATPDDIRRFWRQVQRTSTCWIWIGATGHGGGGPYGRFSLNNKLLSAHRFAYELFVGPIPDGMQLDHLCQRTTCVNPDHLEAVSAVTNLLRGNGVAATNARKTQCSRGHPFDEANTYIIPSGKGRACLTCRKLWVTENIEKVRAGARLATAAYRARQKAMNSL